MKQEQAFELLRRLGAPARLLRHVLSSWLRQAVPSSRSWKSLGVQIDKDFILSGIVLHDVGKTVHLLELGQEGELHRETGRDLLLRGNRTSSGGGYACPIPLGMRRKDRRGW